MSDFSTGDLIVLIDEDGKHPFTVVAPRKRQLHLLLRSCVTGRAFHMSEDLLSLKLWRGSALHFRNNTEGALDARALTERMRPHSRREFDPKDYLKYGPGYFRRFLKEGAAFSSISAPQLQDDQGDRQ
ncbi:hypothetical protein ELH26_12095 [Rhizobium leguminosarum]|uniref:hypothetical protein n=1 Tax=Rhizobium leguminosarum TaxID=384 RepID=UPI001031931A|nr:hypothetical protein [Rhizobium leguminosarum]TBC94720.1 hypothetical protein ELH26_12095 [Rhizobium leguminosarum]